MLEYTHILELWLKCLFELWTKRKNSFIAQRTKKKYTQIDILFTFYIYYTNNSDILTLKSVEKVKLKVKIYTRVPNLMKNGTWKKEWPRGDLQQFTKLQLFLSQSEYLLLIHNML